MIFVIAKTYPKYLRYNGADIQKWTAFHALFTLKRLSNHLNCIGVLMSKSKQSIAKSESNDQDVQNPGQFKDIQSLLGNAEMQKRLQVGQDGLMSFLGTVVGNVELDGLKDRYREASDVKDWIDWGLKPEELQLKPEDFRLRNIAEMSDVANQVEGSVDHPAAHSLRDANFWFYTLFANKGGSMEALDMQRYREVAAMPGDKAADQVSKLEAEAFEQSADPETNAFGKSLSVEHRRRLFLMHNQALSPAKNGDKQ